MESIQTPERENNQLVPFNFENHTVRAVVIENEPWFVAKDVGEALGLSAIKTTLQGFPENERGVHTMYLRSGNGVQQSRKMLTVNEPGLYRLVFQSRKPEAEQFKTWVFAEVLPSIRRTGMFLPEGINAMIRATVTDVVAAMEREAIMRRGTLLTAEERRFYHGPRRIPGMAHRRPHRPGGTDHPSAPQNHRTRSAPPV